MKLRINEDYYDNKRISDLLFDIENSGNERKIDKAYSYIDSWLDNPEDVYNDDYYDFTNASWGVSEENIIEYLTNILNESINITKRNINEKETPNIEVKNKGVLEVPEGKNVDDLPLSHFVKLANKKGLSKITKALNNLQVWNKNDDKKLSKWAGDMIDKLNKKLKKDESVSVKDIRAITNSDRAMDYLTKIQSSERNLSNFTPYERKDALRNTRKYVKYINDEIKDTLPIMQQEEDDYNNYFLQNDLDESSNIKESSDKKSYWKYNLFDRAIERVENSDRYFDERTIRQVKLYPCETEDECYEGDFWAVSKSYSPYGVVFGTKDEAYKELMYYLNNSMYEKDNDL